MTTRAVESDLLSRKCKYGAKLFHYVVAIILPITLLLIIACFFVVVIAYATEIESAQPAIREAASSKPLSYKN